MVPPTVYRGGILVMRLCACTHTRARPSTLRSVLFFHSSEMRLDVRGLAVAARTHEIATLPRSFSPLPPFLFLFLSVFLSFSSYLPLPLRASETRALQPNKGNLRRHPFTRHHSYLLA